MRLCIFISTLLTLNLFLSDVNAQITERKRPQEWDNLKYGGRFMDRFLPMPSQGELTSDTWGGDNVLQRYTDNGIDDNTWSYWGGNAKLGDDDKYHLFVCGWLESSSRGHGAWPGSTVFHAVADNSFGPYQVTDERVYPPVEGRFEDPLVWRTNIQYHLIVNDWLGRIAFYLRSKDGINWKTEPGEAYLPGIAKYEDGTVVDWFKYERIKVLQDKYGRATQAHFAVIDILKKKDKSSDNHSSKHICIPLTVGRLLTIMDEEQITAKTKTIRVKIEAEDGFNPHTDIDLNSLRFGASEEVNFNRGSEVLKTEKSGKDLIVTFNGNGNGITDENFAAKLLGKTTERKLNTT